MMRVIRATATLVLIVVAVSSSSAVRPGDDALVTRTATRLDALTISIDGSAEELRAAERVNYHRIEDGTAACMRAAGRAYRPVPFAPFYRDFTDADVGYGTGRASAVDSLTEHGRRLVRNAEASGRVGRAEAERGVADADVDAFNTCTAPYEHRAYYDIDLPAVAQHLDLDDLVAPLRAVPEVAAAEKPYRGCMKARGYTVDDRDDFLFRPRPLAAVEAVFTADATCRRPAYASAMRVLAARITPWQQQHRAQLDTIRQQWQRTVAEAAQLDR